MVVQIYFDEKTYSISRYSFFLWVFIPIFYKIYIEVKSNKIEKRWYQINKRSHHIV